MPAHRPIRKLLCANRGEIAIRVFRAATELDIRTVAVFSHEDRVHLHRYKADEAYLIGRGQTPVGAYLNIEEILDVATTNHVDAIHPGYGFLSERAEFADRCREAGITFIGPTPDTLRQFGDKTTARRVAQTCGVPVIPGSDGATLAHVEAFAEARGYPLMIKAAMGGGGRGMRVVRSQSELAPAFERATSEAQAAFGDGKVFVERYLDHPRHIEVQILGDGSGEVVHLFERDCSVQRRHQKLVEIAPAPHLSDSIRKQLQQAALRIAQHVNYANAGTVEFLVVDNREFFFIEVNPRIQVEHTVTEEVTGIDVVQSQIRVASGQRLADLGLSQKTIGVRGSAIQCRVTTEDPEHGFAPDNGRIVAFRAGQGMGIRLDGGSGYAGAEITPHYDSLLVKVTGHALTFEAAARKLRRALAEFRVRGVKTNIPFLQNVLRHPQFLQGAVHTTFVDDTPDLFRFSRRRNRAQRLLRYLGDLAVNGPSTPWISTEPPARISPEIPALDPRAPVPQGWRRILLEQGPDAFAKAVRQHPGLLLTDTTWRDAHQSLLATRVRTADLAAIAPATAHAMFALFSLEMWGGATFDVALRFLRECPWSRLEQLRALVPNIPFQMLLRGANAVGYTNYPDNVVRRFTRVAKQRGIDVFRIFDCLNYVENLQLGIDAVGEAGGVIECALCYSGDVSDPGRTKYSLQYYLDLAGQLIDRGIHVLAIKDMAGLLKPRSARELVGALRTAFPYVPIHVHTHDTAGTGVASMLASADAGADVVDVAITQMAGMTSQPALGAVVAALRGSESDTGVSLDQVAGLATYWEQARKLYAPFESGIKSGSADVYAHEMPGGQYTNLQFQAQQLGLASRWSAIKRAYAEANAILGDLIKVTPSSKVVGDLAQFMVQNDLSGQDVIDRAETLSFPTSVTQFMLGQLGEPHGGYPEPLRERIVRGQSIIRGRPGASLPAFDFDALAQQLERELQTDVSEADLLSAALYPDVFREYADFRRVHGDVSSLPTRNFLAPMAIGEELAVTIERGKTLIVKLTAVGELDARGQREVFFELNGQPRSLRVADRAAQSAEVKRDRADASDAGSLGAPMPGAVVDVRVAVGDPVAAGDPVVVLSAMKMETVVAAPIAGRIARVAVSVGDTLAADDLLCVITSAERPT